MLKHIIFTILVIDILIFPQGNDYKLISQYVQQKWSTENGLPHNSITAITQTKDGYMWFGSNIGLIRFNGIDFTLYDKKNHPEVNLTDIWSLASDNLGNLWIGSNSSGLIEYKNGEFKSYTTKDGLADNSVWSLYVENDNTLWIGTGGGGISILKNGRFKTINQDNGLSSNYIWCFSKDKKGNYWIGTDGNSLDQLNGNMISVFDSVNGFPGNYVMASLLDTKGNLWFGVAGVGLVKYNSGKFKLYSEKEGLVNNIIWSIKEDSKNNIWIGTDGGLTKISDGKFDSYSEVDGLTNNSVKCIYTDREGNIWTGTSGGGIIKFRNGPITTYTTKQGLPHNNIFSICQDKFDYIWFGTSKGLSRLEKGKFHTYYYSEGLNADNILSFNGDKNGNLWIGTDGLGLYCLSNGKFKKYTYTDGLLSNTIWSILEDRKGTMWFGTDGKGISRLKKDGSFYDLGIEQGLSGEFISALLEDHNGIIWAGTRDSSGLNRIKENKIKVFKVSDGLLSNNIYSLFEDKENNLWVGTDAGLNKIKDGKIFKYTKEIGLHSDIIYSINEDDLGFLWISSSEGIFNIWIQEFELFDKGLIKRIGCRYFDASDGMKSSECNPGSPSSFKTKDGNLWFPTIQGAAVINPSKIDINKVPPNIFIDSVISNDKKYSADSFQTIPAGSDFFEFHYSALSFSVPQKVLYRYKLEGFDTAWIEAGNNHIARYPNINPGKYKFIVTACNNDGLWNTKGASFEFELKPHSYQTAWFYLLVSVLLYFLVFGIIKIRTGKLQKREKLLSQKVEERSAELIEENKFRKRAEEEAKSSLLEKDKLLAEKTNLLEEKEILLKEIHHRVKNNLQIISSLLYLNSKKINDKEALNIFKDSQNRVKSIALVHERLYRSKDLSHIDFKEYIQKLIKDLFTSFAVDPSLVKIKLDIDKIFINVDFAVPCGLIINELVSNSLKYAFPGYKENGKEALISISFNRNNEGCLTLIVKDTGVGLPGELNEKKKDSLGLQLIETLITQLNGSLEISNHIGAAFKIHFKSI